MLHLTLAVLAEQHSAVHHRRTRKAAWRLKRGRSSGVQVATRKGALELSETWRALWCLLCGENRLLVLLQYLGVLAYQITIKSLVAPQLAHHVFLFHIDVLQAVIQRFFHFS